MEVGVECELEYWSLQQSLSWGSSYSLLHPLSTDFRRQCHQVWTLLSMNLPVAKSSVSAASTSMAKVLVEMASK